MLGKTILHYKILEKLGEGGMGVVYKAEDTKLKRTVALKFLPLQTLAGDEEKTRFEHEAQAAAALDHPNICTVYEINEADGQTFIAMAYVAGKSLQDIVGAQHAVSLPDILNYATQIAEGLQAAHEKDIVHRDIKPANILITQKGQVRITDFGLAKLAGRTQLTKEGTSMGTVAYMSPEQTQGIEVNQRTDIWALGAVIYEMITGKQPFVGDYEQAVMYSIMNEDPEPPTALRTGVPMELERIVLKALAKEPGERYQRIDEMLVDLRALQKTQEFGVSATQTPAVWAGFKPAHTRTMPLLIGGLAVLALLVVSALFMFKTTPADAISKKSIAVLPFENLSGKQEEEYFSDGMTEDVLAQIAKIADLKVISRAAIRHYKNTEKSPQEIGTELGVANLLMGTVRREGNDLRIRCELVNAATGVQLWSKTYDRKLENVFAIQSEVAQQIAQTLEAELSGEEKAELGQPLTANLEAYDYYLRGNGFTVNSNIKQDAEEAVRMYAKAVELDSTFAVAYAALAQASIWLFELYAQKDMVAKAKAAVDRAQALAPDSPETHIALGDYFYRSSRDYDQALEHLTIAQRRRPNDAMIIGLIGWIQRRQGKWQEHVTSMEKAIELNPRYYNPIVYLGSQTYFYMGQYSQAERYLDRAISLAPDNPLAYKGKIKLYKDGYGDTQKARMVVEEASGRIDPQVFQRQLWEVDIYDRNYEQALKRVVVGSDTLEYYLDKSWTYYFMKQTKSAQAYADSARMLLEPLIQSFPLNDFDIFVTRSLGQCYALLDRKEEAIREGRKAVDLMPVSKDAFAGPFSIVSMAKIYTLVGDHDAAIDQLAYLLSIPCGMTVHRIRLNPVYDPLRGHPRFQELLAKYSVAQ
ncbi:MAG: tetratricopeptide repeat protein [Caldithrix sp.]|nr:MAG: tetratricopeptide repeat protein [Caldithrix sp.]